MSKFYVSLAQDAIADQIAALLNKQNKLTKIHNRFTIKGGTVNYFIEICNPIKNGSAAKSPIVIGCAGLLKENPYLSTIKHVSVSTDYRKLGIARKLIQLAIDQCTTEHIRMTIREDNKASLELAQSLNFKHIITNFCKDHNVITVGRRRVI